MPLRTLEQVKESFEAEGTTYCSWADAHGFSAQTVYAVLSGRAKGRRGEAHRIAVALGIKAARLPAQTLSPEPGVPSAVGTAELRIEARYATQNANKEPSMS